MAFDPERHHRRSIRLPHHDYGSPGAYFVTVVTANRDCLFSNLRLGPIAERCWLAISRHDSHATLDAWVVMPNHLHGIVVLDAARSQGHDRQAAESSVHAAAGSLGAIVGNFKSVTARRINRVRRTPGAPVWQRNYYERIIRNEKELQRIRAYVAVNPIRWALDRENPERLATRDEWTADEDRWFTV